MNPVNELKTVEEKFEVVLAMLTKAFGESDKGGIIDGDGFSFDFSIPDTEENKTLSVQVGVKNEENLDKGYYQCYLYDHKGNELDEWSLDFKMEEDFDLAVVRSRGYLTRTAKKVKEGKL